MLIAVGLNLLAGGAEPIFETSPDTSAREINEAYFRLFGDIFTALVAHVGLSEIAFKVSAGKFIAGIRTQGETGAAVSKGQAFIRNIAKFVSVYLFGVGIAWALIDRRNRMWHDLMSGTYVADARAAQADAQSS